MKPNRHFCKNVCTFIIAFPFFPPLLFSQTPTAIDSSTEKNIEIFSAVYQKLVSDYPLPFDKNAIVEKGINEMLMNTDPFTGFMSKEEAALFNGDMSGKFGGVGMVIGADPDGFFVQSTFSGFPAERGGIVTADRILKINETDLSGKSIDDVIELLRGEPGTALTIQIQHAGKKEMVPVQITREEINLSPVTYCGMLDDHIAYISIQRETANCAAETEKALTELYNKNHFTSLVLDLRNNEGGYLKQAVAIASLFIDQKALLVSVRDKTSSEEHFAGDTALFADIPMVVLINNYTASSGEILSGALQDNDRGVLIGQVSYGKGLVQQLYDMPYGTELKLTVGHYYTPSGRCIQAFDYNAGDKTALDDSLKQAFKTKKGRMVYSSGGISPDITTVPHQTPLVLQTLLDDQLIFQYATNYYLTHKSIPSAHDFQINDPEYSAFIDFAQSMQFQFNTDADEKLEALKQSLRENGATPELQEDLEKMEADLQHLKANAFIQYEDDIRLAIEAEILSRYYKEDGRSQKMLMQDDEVNRAIEILKDPAQYKKLLNITGK